MVFVQGETPRALVIRFTEHALDQNHSVVVDFGLDSALKILVGGVDDAVRSVAATGPLGTNDQRLSNAIYDARDRDLRNNDSTAAHWRKLREVCGVDEMQVL